MLELAQELISGERYQVHMILDCSLCAASMISQLQLPFLD